MARLLMRQRSNEFPISPQNVTCSEDYCRLGGFRKHFLCASARSLEPSVPRLLRALDQTLSFVFQARCLGCDVRTASMLCERCAIWPRLERVPGGYTQSELRFQEPWRALLHQIKYSRNFAALTLFRPLCEKTNLDFIPPEDRFCPVVPVPLHWRAFAKRGFNQSEYLAQWIAKPHGMPILSDSLKKIRKTPAQSTLEKESRQKNLKRAFSWKGPTPKAILLVDDVWTTGSTFRACAEAVCQSGVARVYSWTLFRAQ